MMSKAGSLFMRVWNSNAVEDVPNMTDVLKKHISVAQHNVEILEKIYSETRREHVGIELTKGELIISTPPIGHHCEEVHQASSCMMGFNVDKSTDPLNHQPYKQHQPIETDESDNPPAGSSEINSKKFQEAVNKIKDSLKKCQDAVEYYDRNRQVQSSRDARYPSAKKQNAIQLYCAQKTDLTDYAIRELETKLRSQQGMKLQMQICQNISSIQSFIPLIVICLSSSRLGVDLSAAISGLPTGPNTAVLIFHHKKPHALPTEPSNAVLKEDEFKNVGIIIDVAFFEDMGLYDCDMNTSAYKSLISFIEGHCTK